MTFTGLHRALGIGPQEITFEMVDQAVQEGISETYDLDWKSELPEQRKLMGSDLPKDIAAMANSGGGVVIYGVTEEEKSAVDLIGVDEVNENYEQTLMRAPIHRIHPPVHGVIFHRLRQSDKTVLVLEVPASIEVPHLVGQQESFGAPVRVGADTHWMSEPEIERMYRRRFDERRHADEALQQLVDDLAAYTNDEAAWIICAARPVRPNLSDSLSKDEARQAIQDAAGSDFVAEPWGAGPLHEAQFVNPRRGYRSWVFQNPSGRMGHLAPSVTVISDDGSAGLAVQIGGFTREEESAPFSTVPQIIEVSVADLVTAAWFLSAQSHTSSYDIAISIVSPQPVSVYGYGPFGDADRAYSQEIRRFRSIRSTMDFNAETGGIIEAVREIALDCLNQAGIEQLRQIHPCRG